MSLKFLTLLALPLAGTVQAQSTDIQSAVRIFSDDEITAVPMPDLKFETSESVEADFDKYYYFYRSNTSFAEAFADITECDSLSSGITYYSGGSEPYPGYYGGQYGVGGVIGSALGNALGDMIHGSATRRNVRRINIRNCMGFKEYDRFGLKKDLWSKFNFEEGNGRKDDEVREAALLMQAKVASGVKPETRVLGI